MNEMASKKRVMPKQPMIVVAIGPTKSLTGNSIANDSPVISTARMYSDIESETKIDVQIAFRHDVTSEMANQTKRRVFHIQSQHHFIERSKI